MTLHRTKRTFVTLGLAALVAGFGATTLVGPAAAAADAEPADCAQVRVANDTGEVDVGFRRIAWNDVFGSDGVARPGDGAPCFPLLHVDSLSVNGSCFEADLHPHPASDGWTTSNVARRLTVPAEVVPEARQVRVQFFDNASCVRPLGDEVTYPRVRANQRVTVFHFWGYAPS